MFHIKNARLFIPLLALPLTTCKGEGSGGPKSTSTLTPVAPVHAAGSQLPNSDLTGLRSSYDLIDNRIHGLLHQQNRLLMNAGDASFYKFVDGNWKSTWILGQRDGNRPAALISGISAAFSFPVDKEGDGILGKNLADLQLSLHVRSLAPNQRLSIFVNEKAVATLDVTKDAAVYDALIPASALTLGENRIRLTFRSAAPVAGGKRSAAAIYSMEIGEPRKGAAMMNPSILFKETELAGIHKRALMTKGPSRLSFYTQVPPQARLALSLGSLTANGKAVLRVVRDGAAPLKLWEGTVTNRFADAVWDLGSMAKHAVRIDLVTESGDVLWGEPRILVPAAPKAAPPKTKFDRIYVWMIDTLRADKVRAYNPKTNVQTPNYDAFAADSTRFAWAQVQGTWSLPSQASMLTGVYPTVHKATEHVSKISSTMPFASEILKSGGFRTALFSSNGYVSTKWGFGRGWDENRNLIRESLPNGADALWALAKKWIFQNQGKPQFIYLAVIEPHVIYNPKKEFLVKYWDKPYTGPFKPALTGIQLGKIKQGKLKVNETDKAYLEALHNAEITQSDTAFGVFLADLKAAGLYDRSAVIVISDHGDEFWDHGDVGHAQAPHQELVHVPLMIRAPGLLKQGQVVESDVEAMDLFPTLLELAGQPVPETTQGRSILAVALDEIEYSPASSLTQTGMMYRGFKSGRYRFNHQGVAKMTLFDEFEDPREQHDLSAKRPIALRQMRSLFSLQVGLENQWRKHTWGTSAKIKEGFYQAVSGK
jgi:arylsulfatase A-like enzyme